MQIKKKIKCASCNCSGDIMWFKIKPTTIEFREKYNHIWGLFISKCPRCNHMAELTYDTIKGG